MIFSMTGFARFAAQTSLAEFIIELKAVNHRFLDITLSLPDGLMALDIPFRQILREKLSRGRVECSVKIRFNNTTADFQLDDVLLQKMVAAVAHITYKSPHVTPSSALDILQWPGVLQSNKVEVDTLQPELIEALHKVITDLQTARLSEGAQIKQFILTRLLFIESFIQILEQELPKLLEHQQARLLKKFHDAQLQLEPERLAQEMVLFSQRIDIAEEIARLKMHIHAVKQLLEDGGKIGRKLDFMMQELNREANTIGSKSFSAAVTQHVVDVKVAIEEMREQIQNVE